MALGELLQHVTVGVVALGALGVVLRKVLGLVESSPPSSSQQKPACGHCAAAPMHQRKSGA